MRSPNDSAARRLFGFSIVYLFLLFLGLVIDRAIMPERFLAGVL
jgi:heme O synthase-like polyprenyltransferase